QLHAPDQSRISLKRFCAEEEKEIPSSEIVKGYEVGPDEYVIITPEELDSLAPEMTNGIEIEEFVDLVDIDPVYFESSYYLAPDKKSEKAYALLLAAMRDSNKVALGKVVMRNKQYLTALRAAGNAISMATLYYPDEVTSLEELDGLPKGEIDASPRELAMAQQLIEALSGPFEPEKYRDEYREQLMQMIDEKASGKTIVALPQKKETASKAVDLMAALEASIAAAKDKGGEKAKKSA
ncbi:DNA repair protein, partial [bacterium SCGC AG-212-C10]